MVDSTKSLFSWIAAQEQVKAILADHHKLRPEQIDVQSAAMAKMQLDDPTDLLDRIWDSADLLSLIRDIDFSAWNNFEDVLLHASILPPGIPGRADEETIKALGEKWRIHKYDADPFPALPHAHNLYNGYKLDLSNGNLYRRRQFVGQLPRKDLLLLRDRVRNTPLPPLSV